MDRAGDEKRNRPHSAGLLAARSCPGWRRSKVLEVRLTADEARRIDEVIASLADKYEDVEDAGFLQEVTLHAHELPWKLREVLQQFRLRESSPVCLISGFPIDDDAIGKTPAHWRDRDPAATRRENFYLMLCCHLLGDAVAWATEQAGRLVHEVLPIYGNDGGQLGTSTDPLEWHTEDAFHPERMDYVALMCLRNQDRVATTFAYVEDLDLDERTRAALSRPAYPYQPDEGNRADRELSPDETGLVAELITSSHARVQQMFFEPDRVQALFGGPNLPYIRVHPYYIAGFGEDAEARDAFERLKAAVNEALREVILSPGDLLFIDNFRAVHGRRKIPGHYDGTDRWLKRAFVVRDLRKTRHLRAAAEARVVY
jgi:Fe(II)/alpha-ketoglutarate-dependent arginine beta-hydroxylase